MKVDTSYTPEEILEYSTRDFVISAQIYPDYMAGTGGWVYDSLRDNKLEVELINDYGSWGSIANVRGWTSVLNSRYPNDGNRKIGIIRGVLDDGSFCVDIIGNGIIDRQHKKFIATELFVDNCYQFKHLNVSREYFVDLDGQSVVWGDTPGTIVYKQDRLSAQFYDYYDNRIPITMIDSSMFIPEWQTPYSSEIGDQEIFLHVFGKLNNQEIGAYTTPIQLTPNPNTSLRVGDLYNQYEFFSTKSDYLYNGYKNIGGDFYSFLAERATMRYDPWAYTALRFTNQDTFPDFYPKPTYSEMGTYCAHWIPFNLILTRNESEAIEYINNGTLPSDAFIYPYDVDNIPINTDGIDPGNEPTDVPLNDVPNEDGTPNDNCNPMPTEEPSYNAQSLTNNNLYWLSANDLKQFINWFWTDATDIASVGDLWDKITGLYENLGEALLQIRYMPVDASWIGGTTGDTKIIVGMIEKTHAVQTINKSVPSIRRIGHIKVPMLYNGSWVNYTPYSSMSLYLPFHGMVSIDNDFVMGHEIYVECVYDVLSGTVQYFLHRDSYDGSLIYSTIARMCEDIPISLQTKSQRDSAVLQNVSNLTAGLIGAGASMAMGNPVGMTMGLSNLASYQPASAGMKVMGNVGEGGAFYAPRKCALYIKRPAYNRPSNYKSRVGYPANKTLKLSSCSGFTTCYQPRITFTGNEYDNEGVHGVMKPLQSEVEEIYELLEKGVIL